MDGSWRWGKRDVGMNGGGGLFVGAEGFVGAVIIEHANLFNLSDARFSSRVVLQLSEEFQNLQVRGGV